jgi:hypothetical protein
MLLFFCNGRRRDTKKLREVLELFGRATGMRINNQKSTLSPHQMEEREISSYKDFLPFSASPLRRDSNTLVFI